MGAQHLLHSLLREWPARREIDQLRLEDLGGPEGAFEAWLEERCRTHDMAPRDSSQVSVCEILNDYAAEHGPYVASPASLAYAVEPLQSFFAEDTVATLTVGRIKQYLKWRRKHSVQTVRDKALKQIIEKRVIDAGGTDGTIIRELAGTLRPAIQHAIQQKRLAPGEYYVPVPSEPPGRDYWSTRSEAARLLRETCRDKRARLHLPPFRK